MKHVRAYLSLETGWAQTKVPRTRHPGLCLEMAMVLLLWYFESFGRCPVAQREAAAFSRRAAGSSIKNGMVWASAASMSSGTGLTSSLPYPSQRGTYYADGIGTQRYTTQREMSPDFMDLPRPAVPRLPRMHGVLPRTTQLARLFRATRLFVSFFLSCFFLFLSASSRRAFSTVNFVSSRLPVE